jgi:hypothetical protein
MLLGVLTKCLLHGLTVKLEFLGFGLELALELLGLRIVLSPVFLVLIGLRVIDALLLEIRPTGNFITFLLFFTVPNLLGRDLGGNLGELGGVGRFLFCLGIFK